MKNVDLIKQKIKNDGFDALVISDGADIRYLTGFLGEYNVAVVILTCQNNYFVTDGRFITQAKIETTGYEIVDMKVAKTYFKMVGKILKEVCAKKVAIQQNKMTYKDYLDLSENNEKILFENAPSYIKDLRAIKTNYEIDLIKKACEITESTFDDILNFIKPGVTEIEIANEIENLFRKKGSSGTCFDTIIASGPQNGACCHAIVSDRKIEYGDFVTIDFGAYYKGYCSDMTRTVAVGKVSNELKKIYEIVKEAKMKAQDILKAGVKACEIDKAGRSVVEKYGYEIPHGLGHSFGLEIHEYPTINSSCEYILKPNVVHTIEPGIYIQGVGGVRIEDDYIVTEDGFERIQKSSNELVIL